MEQELTSRAERIRAGMTGLELAHARRCQPARPQLVGREGMVAQFQHAVDTGQLDQHAAEVKDDHVEWVSR